MKFVALITSPIKRPPHEKRSLTILSTRTHAMSTLARHGCVPRPAARQRAGRNRDARAAEVRISSSVLPETLGARRKAQLGGFVGFRRVTARVSGGSSNDDAPVPYRRDVGDEFPPLLEGKATVSSTPSVTRRPYTTLAERLANTDSLRRNFTIGLKWWTPLSPIDGFEGVAEACSRLWENTVLLSALITSFAMFAVTFPISEIIHAEGSIPQVYAVCWTLAFCFCATAGFGATILLNKICKCAPQNYSIWFTKFGGFVELPQLFLYVGGWCAFAGCLVSLSPIYKSSAVTASMTLVFATCASLVTAMYSQTTDFEKACAKEGQRRYVSRTDERNILDAFEDEIGNG